MTPICQGTWCSQLRSHISLKSHGCIPSFLQANLLLHFKAPLLFACMRMDFGWVILTVVCLWPGDSLPSTSSMSYSKQPGHSRSTTSAMTVSDMSTTTGFSDTQPVMQQQPSDSSALSGVPSGEVPGRTGVQLPPVPSHARRCSGAALALGP